LTSETKLDKVKEFLNKLHGNTITDTSIRVGLGSMGPVGAILLSLYDMHNENNKENVMLVIQRILEKMIKSTLDELEKIEADLDSLKDVIKNKNFELKNVVGIMDLKLDIIDAKLDRNYIAIQENKDHPLEIYSEEQIKEIRNQVQKELQKIDYENNFGLEKFSSNDFISTRMVYDYTRKEGKHGTTWDDSDLQVIEKGIDDKLKTFDEVLNLRENDYFVIIGATYGNGKTTTMQNINQKFLNKWIEAKDENKNNEYLPIFVPLKLRDSYRILREPFEKFIEKYSNHFQKILLILDGLDEYKQDKDKLFEMINNLGSNHPGLRTIITTRLDTNLPVEQKSMVKYIRLLPFEKQDVDKFLFKDDLTYEKLKHMGLNEDEITKPLFCKMIRKIKVKLKENIHSGKSIHRGLLYRQFIHSRLLMRELNSDDDEGDQKEEKQLLRKIAALKSIYSPYLKRDELNEKLEIFEDNPNSEQVKKLVEKILTTYFHHPTQKSTKIFLVDFLHKSFQEYLVAEFYLEAILSGKKEWLNIGGVTKETIEFLKDLVLFVKEDTDESRNFLKTFEYEKNEINESDSEKKSALDILIDNTKQFVELDDSLFFIENEPPQKYVWTKSSRAINSYKFMWIYRWISLAVHGFCGSCEDLESKKLEQLLQFSLNSIENYLKIFNGANLSNTTLSGAYLYHATLSGANLTGTHLSLATLSGAYLSGANLTGTYLFDANLSDAHLSGANLSDAHLSGANLSDANLSGANLSNAHLSDAHFIRANLSDANLSDAHLSGANLSDAHLSGANLSDANLSDANLSNAHLSNANLIRAHLSGANLSGANLSGANFTGIHYDERYPPNFGDNYLGDEELPDYNTDVLKVLKTMSEKLRKIFLDANPKYVEIWKNKKTK